MNGKLKKSLITKILKLLKGISIKDARYILLDVQLELEEKQIIS